MKLEVAVLVPCFNEAATIGKVVRDFYAALPECRVFVGDNGSTDDSATLAAQAGAVVLHEPLPGKGNVVRRMFADVEADVYVLVDGDDTYDASYAPQLIEVLLNQSLDLVSAARNEVSAGAYRRGHRFGNRLLTSLVASLFGNRFSDMLSGYRVISRRLVKSFPLLSAGFEIETELTVHALQLRVPIAEIATPYRDRPQGSVSKLHTYRDGFRIVTTIARLVKAERPMYFFGVLAALLASASLLAGIPVIQEFLRTGLVPRQPTVVLAASLMMLACLSLTCGLILETVTRGRIEQKRMRYLAIPLARPPWDTRSGDATQEDGYLRQVAPRETAAPSAGRRPATHVVANR
jgi:glycosyltransferase involved in cell wall biosynthesis